MSIKGYFPDGGIPESEKGASGGVATQSELCAVEASPSTAAHAVGDYLCYNGLLYCVTAAITVGDTLTVGGNLTLTTVGEELTLLKNAIAALST